jgi:hypothetical protein
MYNGWLLSRQRATAVLPFPCWQHGTILPYLPLRTFLPSLTSGHRCTIVTLSVLTTEHGCTVVNIALQTAGHWCAVSTYPPAEMKQQCTVKNLPLSTMGYRFMVMTPSSWWQQGTGAGHDCPPADSGALSQGHDLVVLHLSCGPLPGSVVHPGTPGFEVLPNKRNEVWAGP